MLRQVKLLSRDDIIDKKQLNLLSEIRANLAALNEKLDIIIDVQKSGNKNTTTPQDPLNIMTLLNMPDHLRKTAITICRNRDATAKQIAEHTKRARAVESSYLNQLVTMGYIKKTRKGRKTYFYIDKNNKN